MKLYILHGYDSAPDKNWFPWLKRTAEKVNIPCDILNLPNPSEPNPDEWLASIKEQINFTEVGSEETFFVSHSLGTVATMNFLNSLDSSIKIGGYILVSGFYHFVPNLELLNPFIKATVDYKQLKNVTKNRLVISARNDTIVPTEYSYQLAQNLDCMFIQTSEGGHFMDSEGYTELPLVLEQLKLMITD